MKRVVFAAVLTLILGFSTLGNAALQDNGGGLIYDTDLKITWYDAPAVTRTWADANAWIATLNKDHLGGFTDNGWRLPATPGTVGGGQTSEGEMGHLYWVEKVPGTIPNPFINLVAVSGGDYYWSGNGYVPGDSSHAWTYRFLDGYENNANKDTLFYALAVHVPIPGAILLFGPGLAGIVALKRRIGRRG